MTQGSTDFVRTVSLRGIWILAILALLFSETSSPSSAETTTAPRSPTVNSRDRETNSPPSTVKLESDRTVLTASDFATLTATTDQPLESMLRGPAR